MNSCKVHWNDPALFFQWHLENMGQTEGVKNIDVGAVEMWLRGIFGTGYVIGVIDEGTVSQHPDLATQLVEEQSFQTENIIRPLTARGLFRASLAVGAANNDVCGVGVAPKSMYSSLSVPLRSFSSSNPSHIAAVQRILTYDVTLNDVIIGPLLPQHDIFGHVDGFDAALRHGVTDGRRGKGTLYVWPSGDQAQMGRTCATNGIANSPYTITVGALDQHGKIAPFSEGCSSVLVVAPGSHLRTASDVGWDQCATDLSGTDLAAAIVAGMITGLLEYRSDLMWYDVIAILIESATPTPASERDGDWTNNGAGWRVSEKYGFGLPRMGTVLDMAQQWIRLKNFHVWSRSFDLEKSIPDAGEGMLMDSRKLDFLPWSCQVMFTEIEIDLIHPCPAELEISLFSPSGTKSTLLPARTTTSFQADHNSLRGWNFTTVRNYGETCFGSWILRISDTVASQKGVFLGWTLRLYWAERKIAESEV